MQALIVDDEKIIRMGIVSSVQWSKYGINNTFNAKNGKEALEIIKSNKIDLVITDIKMPIMNGIELSSKIKEFDNNIQIIFISAYQDLDSLKSAIKNSAFDYILKPIDPSELETAILKVCGKIKNYKEKEELQLKLERKLLLSSGIYINRLMLDIIKGTYFSKEYIQNKLDAFDIPFKIQDDYIACIMSLKKDEIEFNSEINPILVGVGIENICKEQIDLFFDGYILQSFETNYIFILKMSDKNLDEVIRFFERIQEIIKHTLNLSVQFGVGVAVNDLFSLSESYAFAKIALYRIKENEKVNVYNNSTISYSSKNILSDDIDNLSKLIKTSDENTFCECIIELINKTNCSNLDTFITNLNTIITLILYCITNNELSFTHMTFLENVHNTISKISTANEANSILIKVFYELKKFSGEKLVNVKNKVTEIIDNFLKENYHRNICIDDISKEVFLTPTYICSLFKDEYGLTITERLTSIRIENAKKLMSTSEYKLYEISELVGYNNPKYFSKIFKKHTGLSPSEYLSKVKV